MIVPGIYRGISNETYHADKTWLSSSQIKVALNSPYYYKHFVLDGKGTKKGSDSKSFGSVVHTMILEPELFDSEYAVFDDSKLDMRRTADKARKEIFTQDNPGKIIISKDTYDKAQLCHDSVFSHPKAKELLELPDSESESSCYAEDSVTLLDGEVVDMKFRVRPDRMCRSKLVIVDLKTAKAADLQGFSRDAIGHYGYSYELSAFMYMKVLAKLLNVDIMDIEWWWIVVKNDEPYETAVYKMSLPTFLQGKKKFDHAVRNIITAERMQDWTFQKQWEEL